MKKGRILAVLLLLIFCMTGCGNDPVIEKDTLSVFRKGTASYTIISEFAEPYYNVEELKAMAQKEIDTYGAGVEISNAEVQNGILNFQYTFASLAHYSGFMKTSCYQGTVTAALANGYKSDTRLISAKGENTITMNEKSIRERNLFVWNEAINVRCDGNVLCYSENLSLINKTDVQPKDGSTGPYYVVYK